jgi:hypothetical protein
MKTPHTGGDWYVERIHTMADKTPHDHDIWAVYSTQRTRYADKPQDICFFNWRTPAGKANAHLISAAPDLLEALQFLLADWIAINGDRITGSRVPAEKAIAAIAKATGE